ncbi:MAG: S8 family serine peptidase [Bdellovibrionota bacterium]
MKFSLSTRIGTILKTRMLITGLLATSTAQAGEMLQFNRGAIDPLAQVQGFSVQSHRTANEYVVQFKNKIQIQDRLNLKAAGIRVLRYLPDDAFIIRASASQREALAQNSLVRVVVPMPTVHKVSKDLVPSVFNRSQKINLLVSAWTPTDRNILASTLKNSSANFQVVSTGHRTVLVETTMNEIANIAATSGVEFVQPHYEMKTMLFDAGAEAPREITFGAGDYTDMTGSESGTKVMNFAKAYELGLTGKGQVVAMADTGLDSGDAATLHADVKGAFADGQIFGSFSKSWEDSNGHGSHVAGSILGNGSQSNGAIKGGAYDSRIVVQSLWNSLFSSLNLPKDLNDLFKPAYAKGARVHSNSWGSTAGFGAYDVNAQEVDEFMYNNPQLLIIFAAGNNGVDANGDGKIDSGNISSPGTAKNVLTVGASENLELTRSKQTPKDFSNWEKRWPAEPISSSKISDNVNGLAMFSSRGPTNDGRVKPDVVAPGTNILSVHSQVPGAKLWGDYNQFYGWAGGTSMATPLTAGAAAVTRQYLSEKFRMTEPSAALVKAVLMVTAFDIYPGQYGEGTSVQEITQRRPGNEEGMGRIDVASIVTIDQQGNVADEKVGVGTDEEKSYDLNLTADGLLEFQLMYTDAPGSPSAKAALVNDLDVSIVDQLGAVIAQGTDRVNNHEYVKQQLKAGQYKLKIKGFKVPSGVNGKQPFAFAYKYLSAR